MGEYSDVRRSSTKADSSLGTVRSHSVEGPTSGFKTERKTERKRTSTVEYTDVSELVLTHSLSADDLTGDSTQIPRDLSADDLTGDSTQIPRDSLSFLLACFPGIDHALLGELLDQPQSDVGSIVEFLLPILDEGDDDDIASKSNDKNNIAADTSSSAGTSDLGNGQLEIPTNQEAFFEGTIREESSLSQYSEDSLESMSPCFTPSSSEPSHLSASSDAEDMSEYTRKYSVETEAANNRTIIDMKSSIGKGGEPKGLLVHLTTCRDMQTAQSNDRQITMTETSEELIHNNIKAPSKGVVSALESSEDQEGFLAATTSLPTIKVALIAADIMEDTREEEKCNDSNNTEKTMNCMANERQNVQLTSEEFDMALLTLCTMFSDMSVEDLSVALTNANGDTSEAIDAIFAGQISEAQVDESAKTNESLNATESKPILVVPSILKEKFPLASPDALADLYADCGYSIEAVLDVAQEYFQRYTRKDELSKRKKAAKGYTHSDDFIDRMSFGPSQVHNVWHNRNFNQGATVDEFRMHLLAAKHPTIARHVVNEVYAMYGYSASACNDHLNLLTPTATLAPSAKKVKKAVRRSNKIRKTTSKGRQDADGFTEVKRKRATQDETRPAPQTSTLTGLANTVYKSNTADLNAYELARGPAQDLALERARCFRKAVFAFQKKHFQAAEFWAMEGRAITERLNRAHARAADKLFKANNPDFPNGPLDLHGLHVDEGIRMVKIALASGRRQQFRIITGVGSHSTMQARLKPAVRALLGSQGYEHFEETPGVLLVNLSS
ncbi:hypothetical protein SARC_02635 [Sphaeroforma arctica JP610]|uniref:Smr domain-containing protein n=1 Tax=Sphaeroforma arctica JP610 TaxID=667725 RepID=A0A0L0GAB0_9EUKA|nr:hypothetical protein SARC_02635 [Sphaeroforma arctica JP610]KNC85178.1 hypothetical protein SARC_02635 [Sphaeroforma arctica JP610]|eukprot:XP_014159080.1 hypothetical protein SARC_02635 [Sphaeroforma arctica JP610]